MVVSFARPEAVMGVSVRSAQHAIRTESTHLRSKKHKTLCVLTCGQTRCTRPFFFVGFSWVARAILMSVMERAKGKLFFVSYEQIFKIKCARFWLWVTDVAYETGYVVGVLEWWRVSKFELKNMIRSIRCNDDPDQGPTMTLRWCSAWASL